MTLCSFDRGRRPAAIASSPHRSAVSVLMAALVLSACGGGGDDAPLVVTTDPAEFSDGLLLSSAGPSQYGPLLPQKAASGTPDLIPPPADLRKVRLVAAGPGRSGEMRLGLLVGPALWINPGDFIARLILGRCG